MRPGRSVFDLGGYTNSAELGRGFPAFVRKRDRQADGTPTGFFSTELLGEDLGAHSFRAKTKSKLHFDQANSRFES